MSIQERSITITNFPDTVTESDVYKMLEGMKDEIEEVKIYDTIAFVTFQNDESIEQAYMYDGTELGKQEISIDVVNSENQKIFEEYEVYFQQKQQKKLEELRVRESRQKELEEKLKEQELYRLSQSLKDEDEQLEEQIEQEEDKNIKDNKQNPSQRESQQSKLGGNINFKMNVEDLEKMTESQQIEFQSTSQLSEKEDIKSIIHSQSIPLDTPIKGNVQEKEISIQEIIEDQNKEVQQSKSKKQYPESILIQEPSKDQQVETEQEQREVQNEIIQGKQQLQVEQKQENYQQQKTENQNKEQESQQEQEQHQEDKEEKEKEDQVVKNRQIEKDQQEQQDNHKIMQEKQDMIRQSYDNLFNSNNNSTNNTSSDSKLVENKYNSTCDGNKQNQNNQQKVEKYSYEFQFRNVDYIIGIIMLVLWFVICKLSYKVFDLERNISDQQSQIDNLLEFFNQNNNTNIINNN